MRVGRREAFAFEAELEKVGSLAEDLRAQLERAVGADGFPEVPQVFIPSQYYEIPATYSEPVLVTVLGAGLSVLLWRIFWSGKSGSSEAAGEEGSEDADGAAARKELGGPRRWAGDLLFGEASSPSWLVIVVTLLMGSSLPRFLLEDNLILF